MTKDELELRDKAALAALQGLCAHPESYGRHEETIAERAEGVAAAFMAERAKREQVDAA